MKIAVIGAGAIGGVVAGYLVKAGKDVLLVGRRPQVETIQKIGLRIKGVRGEEVLRIKIAQTLDQPCDLVILTVKTQDLKEALAENRPFINPKTLVMTTQNGVQADRIAGTYCERHQMITSIVMFGATYTKAGEVVLNFEGDWIMGRSDGSRDAVLEEVKNVLGRAFSVVISDDIMGMKWLKLFVNFNNCLPALIGKPMQETFSDLDFCRLSVLLLKEGVSIVQKANIPLVSLPQFPVERILGLALMPVDQAAGIMNQTLTKLSKEPLYGSILQSIMRQKASEIDYINGEVVQLAKHTGTTAPLNSKVVDLVHQVEHSGKFLKIDEVKREFDLINALEK